MEEVELCTGDASGVGPVPSVSNVCQGNTSGCNLSARELSVIQLSRSYGAVLHCHSVGDVLIVVQVDTIQFWKLANSSYARDKWVHAGIVHRTRVPGGHFAGRHGAQIGNSSGNVLYVELWKSVACLGAEGESKTKTCTTLKASCYYCSVSRALTKHQVIDLETLDGCVTDSRFCVVEDLALFTCISTSTSPASYRGNVKKYVFDKTLSRVHNIVRFMFTISPLTYMACVKDSLILGRNGAVLMLWKHSDPNVFTAFRLVDHEKADSQLTLLPLYWTREKEGFLFMVFEENRMLKLIVQSIRTTSLCVLSEYEIPPMFGRTVGVAITDETVVAVFTNGIICWKTETTKKLSLALVEDNRTFFLSEDRVISVKHNYQLHTVKLSECSTPHYRL